MSDSPRKEKLPSNVRKRRHKLQRILAEHQSAKIRYPHKAPEIFTLQTKEYAEQCCKMFDELKDHLEHGFPVHLDFSEVRHLTGGPILYLLSIMDIWDQQSACDIKGNTPANPNLKHYFEQSGFYDHVSVSPLARTRASKEDPHILRITNGHKASHSSPPIPKVLDFIAEQTGLPRRTGTKSLFTALAEIIGNVLDHAYAKQGLPYSPTWWLMASTSLRGMHLVILDNGDTIPQTVNKRLTEKFKSIMNSNNSGFILSALNGKVPRSATKKSYRGQGLPIIKEMPQREPELFEKIIIVSGKEYVTLVPGKVPVTESLEHAFFGTLYSFDIRSSK